MGNLKHNAQQQPTGWQERSFQVLQLASVSSRQLASLRNLVWYQNICSLASFLMVDSLLFLLTLVWRGLSESGQFQEPPEAIWVVYLPALRSFLQDEILISEETVTGHRLPLELLLQSTLEVASLFIP